MAAAGGIHYGRMYKDPASLSIQIYSEIDSFVNAAMRISGSLGVVVIVTFTYFLELF